MKKPDLTDRLMGKVVSFERRRISWWKRRFVFFILVCGFFITAGLLLFILQLWSQQSFDGLVIFWEDPEVFQLFWQDTVMVFWEELPKDLLLLLILSLSVMVIFWLWTRKVRQIVSRRSRELATYLQNRQNMAAPDKEEI